MLVQRSQRKTVWRKSSGFIICGAGIWFNKIQTTKKKKTICEHVNISSILYIYISAKIHADSFRCCFFFFFFFASVVPSVAGVVENGLLSLYSMRASSRGGNHWQHVLFVLACDTARCTERETSNAHLNTADRKSCRGTERHSHSFPLNNIIAYLSQIIVNVHNDFALGYKLCIVHFSAKRLSFRGSNTVCMLHIESCNTDRAFSFRLLCYLNTELQIHLCHIIHSWSKLMSVWWLNKQF